MNAVRMAVIDGTGVFDETDYSNEMATSFCRQIGDQLKGCSRYERGPTDEGYRIAERAIRAAVYLGKAPADAKLMLAGYSRGGSVAIMAAEIMEKYGKKIAAIFLFDPVARHATPGGTVIPSNVQAVYAARRELAKDLVDKYDHTIGKGLGKLAHNPMRVFFGTTGETYLGSGGVLAKTFRGSHGALGGVGWTHVLEDFQCEIDVAAFMNSAFQAEGVAVKLRAYPPSSRP